MRNLLNIEGGASYGVESDEELVILLIGLFLGAGFGTRHAVERAQSELARLPEDGSEVLVHLPDGRSAHLWTEN